MQAYKFLARGAVGRFSGFDWPPAEGGVPGPWVVGGPVALCLAGIHACRVRDLPDWIDDELWEIELDGEIREEPSMVVGERGRLVRRVEGWDEQAAQDLADACAWRTRASAVRALRRDGAEPEAAKLEAVGDLIDMQILAALASRSVGGQAAALVGYAADAVSLARGQRPDSWELGVALAEPAPAQTPAAMAANLSFVSAHVGGLDAVTETGDEAAYASGFAAERAWQLSWLKDRLSL
jgi:hypothetical protein